MSLSGDGTTALVEQDAVDANDGAGFRLPPSRRRVRGAPVVDAHRQLGDAALTGAGAEFGYAVSLSGDGTTRTGRLRFRRARRR